MTTQAEAVDAADAPRLRRELRDERSRGDRLRAECTSIVNYLYRTADTMDNDILRGYADSLREHADDLRAAITRSEA